ncbi:helix-turn-helix domain-containing protein [Streptococcus moroccensis]|uniref:AraC-like DNA-binding protein n=1 Tax=Streptococcus moroccensis TaxID=1451356 RepID=A0ABT9YRA1_9STRE|nr:AraC family transcriptional regulator [Streptococcus moroccensis]MDQ0222126.1 AraC-like DNA-binding protein [Streptococcus moroccensis]
MSKHYRDTIDDFYALENKVLDAVANGDAKEALKFQEIQSKLTFKSRTDNPMEMKIMGLRIFNTLCRKAVERRHIPPVYIDKVSSSLSIPLHQELSYDDLENYGQRIIETYCQLVKDYSDYHTYSPAIQECLYFIETHLNKKLTLDILAQHCHISRSYLSTLFQKEIKQSFTDYCHQLRLKKAKELLEDHSLTINDVAEKCGYQSTDYFSKIFKKNTGQTPSDYRKNGMP